jgi:hypothetical protein
MSVLSQATAKDQDVRSLIYELRSYRWEGPYATALPLQWDLRLTEPMRQILEIGSPAQEALLENITDPLIKIRSSFYSEASATNARLVQLSMQ